MKIYSAKHIASYFIEKSDLYKENDLTNLKLQKLLFYTQAEYYNKYENPLFNDEIEAWDLGPVINSVYQWLKGCGAYPISSFDVELEDTEILEEETKSFLDEIWQKYSKYSAYYLVNKTHESSGLWEEVHNRQVNGIIEVSKLKSVTLQNAWN